MPEKNITQEFTLRGYVSDEQYAAHDVSGYITRDELSKYIDFEAYDYVDIFSENQFDAGYNFATRITKADSRTPDFPVSYKQIGISNIFLQACKDGVMIEEITAKMQIDFEKLFIAGEISERGILKELNTQTVEYFAPSMILNSNDMIMRLILRIPPGEKLTITNQTERHPAFFQEQKFGGAVLQVHYRFWDYDINSRNALYTLPDEALYHIDKETEKWVDGSVPLELSEGYHVVYFAPSVFHDPSILNVFVTDSKGNVYRCKANSYTYHY